jgi:hypothetical protein
LQRLVARSIVGDDHLAAAAGLRAQGIQAHGQMLRAVPVDDDDGNFGF